jgi:hypothetical protein
VDILLPLPTWATALNQSFTLVFISTLKELIKEFITQFRDIIWINPDLLRNLVFYAYRFNQRA